MADDSPATTTGGDADENGLGFGGERDRGERIPDPVANDPVRTVVRGEPADYQRRRSFDAGDLPEGMEARYLIERRRLTGEQRYYENASDTKPAFRDKGDRLVAVNNSRDLIRDMLEIAEHRGWDRVRVSGTEEFRREAWRDAALRGIEVDGYRPKPRELQDVARTRDKRDARANMIAPGGDREDPKVARQVDADREEMAAGSPGSARADFNAGVSGRLSPPLDVDRDAVALASLMGFGAFQTWMRQLLSGDPIRDDGTRWDQITEGAGRFDRGTDPDLLMLEDIVGSWGADKSRFKKADAQFDRYCNALLSQPDLLDDKERAALDELRAIWRLARDRLPA